MPTSNFRSIPYVIHLARELRPASVLDIGLGFGKYGFLLREYLDVQAGQDGEPRYRKEEWKVRIDGVETFADYITPLQRMIYDEIHVADVRNAIHELGAYDLVLMCDVIEHIPKAEALNLLQAILHRCNLGVVLTTPAVHYEQGALYGNPAEQHVSEWRSSDFSRFEHVQSMIADDVLTVVLSNQPLKVSLDPQKSWTEKWRRRLRRWRRGW